MGNHKNTESSIKNLEVHISQLAKQFSDLPGITLSANIKNNSKENCNVAVRDNKIIEANQEVTEDSEK